MSRPLRKIDMIKKIKKVKRIQKESSPNKFKKIEGVNCYDFSRLKVPGGWIIKVGGYRENSICFYPDHEHKWLPEFEDVKTDACLDEVYSTRLDCIHMLLEAAQKEVILWDLKKQDITANIVRNIHL